MTHINGHDDELIDFIFHTAEWMGELRRARQDPVRARKQINDPHYRLSCSDLLLTKVLLATDGSESSENALNYSLGFLPNDVKLIIVSVMPAVAKQELEDSLQKFHEKIVRDAEAFVKKKRPDLVVLTVVDEGIPSDVLC